MRGRTLVSLTHGQPVASVAREASGELWVGDDKYGGTRLTGHRPAVQGLDVEVTLTGGRLPGGAIRAIVHDRAGREHDVVVGEHAWLAEHGLAGHRPTATGHGGHSGGVDSVTLEFTTPAGRVTVETSTEEPFEPPAWGAHCRRHGRRRGQPGAVRAHSRGTG
jgi:hypothetical protein